MSGPTQIYTRNNGHINFTAVLRFFVVFTGFY